MSEQVPVRRRLPDWCIGALIGGAVWGVALFGAFIFDSLEPWLPNWFVKLDLPDTLGSICMVIAAPVGVGGWLLIWGDKGPPHPWLGNMAFNLVFGLVFYPLLGALGTLVVAKLRGR